MILIFFKNATIVIILIKYKLNKMKEKYENLKLELGKSPIITKEQAQQDIESGSITPRTLETRKYDVFSVEEKGAVIGKINGRKDELEKEIERLQNQLSNFDNSLYDMHKSFVEQLKLNLTSLIESLSQEEKKLKGYQSVFQDSDAVSYFTEEYRNEEEASVTRYGINSYATEKIEDFNKMLKETTAKSSA